MATIVNSLLVNIYTSGTGIDASLYHRTNRIIQTTAVTSRRRVPSHRVAMARTAAQVADLPNEQPRHGRHTVRSATARCYDVLSSCVFARSISVLRQRRVVTARIRRLVTPYARHSRSLVNIHYEPASRPRPVAIDVIGQWAGPRVSLRHYVAGRPA